MFVYKLESLSLISAFGVGIDGIDINRTKEQHIRVTNTPDVLNDDVADVALALILTTSRNIINADKYARSGLWERSSMSYGSGLAGKTLGIVGLGRIGQAVVERALPLKLKIAYHNRNKKDSPHKYFLRVSKPSQLLRIQNPRRTVLENILALYRVNSMFFAAI